MFCEAETDKEPLRHENNAAGRTVVLMRREGAAGESKNWIQCGGEMA